MDYLAELKKKYGYISDEDLTSIINKAKMFYYTLSYPADPSVDETTRPINGFVSQQWILAACEELIERQGFSSAVGYHENGVVWRFDNAQLSKALCDQIRPIIGVLS